jgi:hypothetical protein
MRGTLIGTYSIRDDARLLSTKDVVGLAFDFVLGQVHHRLPIAIASQIF